MKLSYTCAHRLGISTLLALTLLVVVCTVGLTLQASRQRQAELDLHEAKWNRLTSISQLFAEAGVQFGWESWNTEKEDPTTLLAVERLDSIRDLTEELQQLELSASEKKALHDLIQLERRFRTAAYAYRTTYFADPSRDDAKATVEEIHQVVEESVARARELKDQAAEAVQQTSGTITSSLDRVIVLMLVSSGLILSAGVGISVLLSRSLAKPIRAILVATEELASGNLTYRLNNTQGDILGRLCRGVDWMAEQIETRTEALQTAHADLESKVRERTAELTKANNRLTRLKMAVEQSMDGIAIMDLDGHIQFVNAAWAHAHGFAANELQGQHLSVFHTDEQMKRDVIPLIEVVKEKKTHEGEVGHARRDGSEFPTWMSVSLLTDENGRPVGIAASAHDITKRKLVEDAVRQSEKRLQALLDANPTGIVVIDAETHEIVDANAAALEMIGASLDDVVGRVCHQYICPAQAGQCPITDSRRTVDRSERVLLKANGEKMPILKTVVSLMLNGRHCLLESFVDITERKHAEDALQEERNKLRSVVDAMDGMEGMLTIQDPDYNIIYQNGIMERTFGGLGEKCYKVYEGKDKVCDGCPVEQAFKDGRAHTSEREVTVLGDEITYFDNTAHPVRNAAGEITSCVEVVRNVTERKCAEKNRERAMERQQRLNALRQSLLGTGTLDEQLKLITDGVVDVFGADFCRIWITKPGDRCESGCMHAEVTEGPHVCRYRDRCLWLRASSGRYTHIDGEVHQRVPFGCYKIGLIASGENSRFLTNEAATDPRVHNNNWAKELGLVSFAGYQLRPPGGDTIGVLALFSKHAISPDEDAMLESLGSTVAQVVQKARAEEEVTERSRFLNSVLESLSHPLVVIDATDYSVVMANTAARRDAPPLANTCHAMSHNRNTPCAGAEHVCPLAEMKRTGKPVTVEHTHCAIDGSTRAIEVHAYPIFDESGQMIQGIEYSLDVTERRQAQERFEAVQRQLQDASHRAGMAEVATGVLHNVGNVLNSVNISASLVADTVRKSPTPGLAKAVALINEHTKDLGAFITEDERGKHLPRFLATLAETLTGEQAAVLEELESLTKNIEHIKAIVSTQQSYAGTSGLVETVSLVDLIEDALKINETSFRRHALRVERDYAELPQIETEKQKLLQILINLVRNARHAMVERGADNGRLILRTVAEGDDRVRIELTDNGVGIPAENLTRIFAHGFTTKKAQGGRGFGLHHSALSAREMGGSLTAHSDGPGTGATFILELPLRQVELDQ